MIRKLIPSLLILSAISLNISAQQSSPSATDNTFGQCEGSLTPYSEPAHPYEYPDSLEPVFINHVGRHGARFAASSANCLTLKRVLDIADSLQTITPLGKKLRALNAEVIKLSNGRWGQLDSLGIAEQEGIAKRMFFNFTEVFSHKAQIKALSTYVPRAMMSMYAFVHKLDELNNYNTYTTTTGRVNNALLRPFDTSDDYLQFRREKAWEPPYEDYFSANCPVSAIERVVGARFPFDENSDEKQRLALVEYYVVAGLSAMGLPSQMSTYFTRQEANALWSCFNLRQYLQRTATTVSSVPADIASDLVMDIIETTDDFIGNPEGSPRAVLRFAHAETLMPLFSLMHIPGAYYMTNYFDTVAQHWCDFNVVPMAANIQFILFKARKSGRYYVRVDVNERPVALRHGDMSTIYPWGELRRYMMNVVAL